MENLISSTSLLHTLFHQEEVQVDSDNRMLRTSTSLQCITSLIPDVLVSDILQTLFVSAGS